MDKLPVSPVFTRIFNYAALFFREPDEETTEQFTY